MIALDSNVLLYAEGIDGERRLDQAQRVLLALRDQPLIIPAQVLGELFRVLTGKAAWPATEAADAVARWVQAGRVQPTTAEIVLEAAVFSAAHGYRIWDAIIVCVAADAGCDILLSEDMQDGFRYRGVTIVNPFTEIPHPTLSALLENP